MPWHDTVDEELSMFLSYPRLTESGAVPFRAHKVVSGIPKKNAHLLAKKRMNQVNNNNNYYKSLQ